jgi:hypothetical protein
VKKPILIAVFFWSGVIAAQAQQNGHYVPDPSVRPKIGMGSKTMAFCTQDTRKFCSAVPGAILKECLVRNWDYITSNCQDALGIPGGDDAEALAAASGGSQNR